MKTVRPAACALLAFALWGCSDDPELVIVVEHPTLVEVSPSEFLGDVPCLEAPGAMRRYVATVFDVTSDEDAGTTEDFPLPSSGATPCSTPVGFAFVRPGRHYAAEVDGYDRTDIEPLATGVRIMVDSKTRERVEPRWTTSCGREAGDSVMAVSEVVRRVSNCAPLVDAQPSDAPAAVSVSLGASLGALSCGADAGQVSRFTVRHSSATDVSAECGAEAVLTGLPEGKAVELELLAFESGQTQPSWGTVCTVTARAGVQVPASCLALSSRGTIQVDLPAALDDVALACDETLREVTVDPEGDTPAKRVSPPGCQGPLLLSELPPGDTSVKITTKLESGEAGPSLTCSAAVLPGLTVRANCSED